MTQADDGYSGNTLDCPAFAQMDADIDAGIIDTVLVKGIDRVARDHMLCAQWVKSLNARGVTLIAMDGSHELSPLLSGIMSALTQYN